MLGNNEKIQGVSIPDMFSQMLSELPWRTLSQYISGNAQLLKVCTFGGHRIVRRRFRLLPGFLALAFQLAFTLALGLAVKKQLFVFVVCLVVREAFLCHILKWVAGARGKCAPG